MPVERSTSRTRLFAVSAMNKSPVESTAIPEGAFEFGGGRRAVVAAGPLPPLPRRSYYARGVDLAYAIVHRVGDEHVSRASAATPDGSSSIAFVARSLE